jgi:hypothetical protein
MLAAGEDHTKPNSIELSPNRDLYIVAGYDKNGEKIKLTLEMIHIDDEDMCPVKQYAHSKVKSFMWLFTSHALPVGIRLRRKETDNRCPHCTEVEDIKHIAFDCTIAKNIRDMVFMEWWSHTTESWWLNHPKFEEAFFNEGTSTFEVLRRTLNDIVTYHIWRYMYNILYRGEITPTVVTANNIWVEFTQMLRARLSHIKAKTNWWTYRDKVQMVPKAIANQYLGKIKVEQSVLLALFSDWEHPRPGTPVSLETLNNLSPYKDNVHRRGQGYNLPPTFPTFDHQGLY